MSARSILIAAFSAAMATWALPPAARAQEQVPQVENSKYRFAAVANANGVPVHAGPGDNYYLTLKLDKGAAVTVIGHSFGWLKVVPPEGSFSVVPKLSVSRDGDVGTITGDSARVRAGSSLTPVKTAVQCTLKKGDKIAILGDQDEYYRIKPPADACVFVQEKFLDPVRQLGTADGSNAPAVPETADHAAAGRTNSADQAVEAPIHPAANDVAVAPATQPVPAENMALKASSEFDRLEGLANASEEKALEEQPITELLGAYQTLLKDDHLPVSMRRVSEARVMALKLKSRAQEDLLATHKTNAAVEARLAAIRAERKTIEDRLNSGVVVYTAVGTLQPSTLQAGAQTIYRLTDPNTSRTVCYARSDAPQFVTFIGQFVGVKGELTSDPQFSLKVVGATEIAAVDPARVGKGVSAQVVPPSLMTGTSKAGETASSGSN